MKRVAATLLVLGASLIAGFAVYLTLMRSPIGAGVTILFYRGVLLAVASAIILVLGLCLASRRRSSIDAATVIAAAALSLSFNLCFLVLLPVTIDRSISVFLLSEIAAGSAEPPTTSQLQTAFERDYVERMRQIDRRVREQTASGNVSVDHGKIRLTGRGERFLGFAQWLAVLFRTDPRFVGLAAPQDVGKANTMPSASTVPPARDTDERPHRYRKL